MPDWNLSWRISHYDLKDAEDVTLFAALMKLNRIQEDKEYYGARFRTYLASDDVTPRVVIFEADTVEPWLSQILDTHGFKRLRSAKVLRT